jgi:hypothetical protein
MDEVRRCWDGEIIRRNVRPVNELWMLAARMFDVIREKAITFVAAVAREDIHSSDCPVRQSP